MSDETTTPPIVPMRQINVTIDSTQRMVGFMVPPDLSDAELIELMSWMGSPANGLRDLLRPKPRIILPFSRPS